MIEERCRCSCQTHGVRPFACGKARAHSSNNVFDSDCQPALLANAICQYFLYPFKLFVTTVHEACHALVTRLTGGNVQMISISPDESGLTLTSGGFRPLISMAGYLGTAAVWRHADMVGETPC